MKLAAALCFAGLFVGMAHAQESTDSNRSHWYCVSESPGGMQSSGHIGYGHGATKDEAARQAVNACRLDGGDQCGAAQCFPE